jgi:aminopeptidase N
MAGIKYRSQGVTKFLIGFLMTFNFYSMNTLESQNDSHSFAKPKEAVITHLSLNIHVNFELKEIHGTAIYKIKKTDSASRISFDTRNLKILEVKNQNGDLLSFSNHSSNFEWMGEELRVSLDKNTTVVFIKYETASDAAALQWLEATQTNDGKKPFLFTQGQAVLTRSWIPIQDSPGIRFTWDATVQVPSDMMALMSAPNTMELNPRGIYYFKQRNPVPAYLIALAVGDIAYAHTGERTGVYAEPGMLEKARNEFSDTEKMLQAAENLYGPYLWGRFDVLVLPPSFPFGGMENPVLTFATPTIIAGDKSLTALIAHELAHSWSGNLVTNATWNDFWLNEGFTVYFERRIMEAIYGKDYADMLAVLGFQDLSSTLDDFGPESDDTKLKLELIERDPDDGMNDIAYEKGCLLLMELEKIVGREKFDAFLMGYFKHFAFKTINTEEFITYLKQAFPTSNFRLEEWIYSPGLPSNIEQPVSAKFQAISKSVEILLEKEELPSGTEAWSSHEWLHFIRQLPADKAAPLLPLLDKVYRFTNSGNSEILAAWFQLSIQCNYLVVKERLHNFLIHTGRRKFLTPLYKTMLENANWKEFAKETYTQARPMYHTVAVQTLDDLILKNN